ncbi:protein translocase subunit secF [Desulfobotulus alkaliphilus]|uniref:Protein-export membrane protein SecF n=1 Tax=Desulfobotulus alkaliphilus TaxID=622671 RepID=A0A562S832_9BACT|nr:protein translocase subunit SecF [Desulfobotulus alkaliphilus]TWI77478.1 protein translocase subunit secF [Desulfobotulus alkaliphilus]
MQIIKPGTNIDFIGKRKAALILSAAMILFSIISLIIHKGPRYGVDFAGGTQILVAFQESVDMGQVYTALDQAGLGNATVQESREGNNFLLQIRTIQTFDADSGVLGEIPRRLHETTGLFAEILSIDMVGPQVSKDLRSQALYALFYALLFITVYISGRFEMKWMLSAAVAGVFVSIVYLFPQITENFFRISLPIPLLILTALILSLIVFWKLGLAYALGAGIALLHDVIITVGLFSVLDIEFNLPIIAAILTIMGYSLNDTIIVFDRVRENLASRGKKTFAAILNKSINETLSRTLITSGTTLLVLIALFVLGGGIIHDFSRALLIGVVVGTYSSIFIACPILLFLHKKQGI